MIREETIVVALIVVLVTSWIIFQTKTGVQHVINDKDAVAAIVGEYAKNDLEGMKMIAHAIRNRGTLKGVYGVHARHNAKEPGYIWNLAKQAWEESGWEHMQGDDPTHGADSWYSEDDMAKHGIPKDKYVTLYVKGTVFFKTIKPKTGGRK